MIASRDAALKLLSLVLASKTKGFSKEPTS